MSEMKTYNITVQPKFKKSISEILTFKKTDGEDKYFITTDQGWRWGKWFGTVSEEDLNNLRQDSDNGVCEPGIYEGLEFDYLDDGVWFDVEGSKNVTSEMIEAFEEAWDADGFDGIYELGWEELDNETFINCELNITIEGEEHE